jgi:hypothetical protein
VNLCLFCKARAEVQKAEMMAAMAAKHGMSVEEFARFDPKPYTLCPEPRTMNPKAQALNPEP